MKHPPYQLRPNKAVDRLYFLREIALVRQIWDRSLRYKYFGLGGPFLEDFRYVQERFPDMKCICIERDEETHKRQKFHKCSRNTVLIKSSIAEYLDNDFDDDQPCIFWLDFNNLKRSLIDVFVRLLTRVPKNSLIKVTLRTHFNNRSPSANSLSGTEVLDHSEEKIIDEFGDALDTSVGDFNYSEFPAMIENMLRIRIEKELRGRGLRFKLFSSFKYEDGPMMLSVSGALVDEKSEDELHLKKIDRIDFKGWGAPTLIDVPNLSVKERLFLERHLPVKSGEGDCLSRALGYRIDRNDFQSQRKLLQYMEHYDCFPTFSRVTL